VSVSAVLALADGSVFHGISIGAKGNTTGEVVFNTAMTGYQEILTDPSYSRQIVTLTYPHIGNTGTTPEDQESSDLRPPASSYATCRCATSNWRANRNAGRVPARGRIVAIAGIDTRRLTRVLREKGAQAGCIMTGENIDANAAVHARAPFPGPCKGMDLAKVVSTASATSGMRAASGDSAAGPRLRSRSSACTWWPTISASSATSCGCWRRGLPHDRGAGADPGPRRCWRCSRTAYSCPTAPVIPSLRLCHRGDPRIPETDIPVFGICLGHQLLGLASGARTIKMKFGHHGANHPVQDLASGRVMITSQNHGFAVDEESLPANVRVTHRVAVRRLAAGHRTAPTAPRSASRATRKRAPAHTTCCRCSTGSRRLIKRLQQQLVAGGRPRQPGTEN
jgi:carbamoyl-phosphate synthase small subunit